MKKFGIKTKVGKLIVRPEQFQLAPKGSKTVSAHIEKIHFMGNHQLLELSAKAYRFYVMAYENELKIGEKVNLGIRSDAGVGAR